LSVYNKSDEHEIIYYQECLNEEKMGVVETLVFCKLNDYREQANREILPSRRRETWFVYRYNKRVYKVCKIEKRGDYIKIFISKGNFLWILIFYRKNFFWRNLSEKVEKNPNFWGRSIWSTFISLKILRWVKWKVKYFYFTIVMYVENI